jgi:uncharacterized protein YcbK (DUF882 family)
VRSAAAETRTIALRNIHTEETLSVVYKRDGEYVPEAMKQIDWILRDWRKDETTPIDPALIDLIWDVHTELGSSEPVNVISGYRSRATNEMLRKTVGGQASESRHILGKAADVQFPDIPLKQLRYSALIRERGGVGYYPTSATPFVHLDTDRVRAWPRLPRQELALLFPSGRTQHLPADGDPITPADFRVAREQHETLAAELAEFHALRKRGRTATLVAAAGSTRPQPSPRRSAEPWIAMLTTAPTDEPQVAPLPKLSAEPSLAERPAPSPPRPTDTERKELTELASLAAGPQLLAGPILLATRPRRAESTESSVETGLHMAALGVDRPVPAPQPAIASAVPLRIEGRFGWGVGWLQAPAYDEEHPEETSYRPFPITPFLTLTASPDDPALLGVDHAPARTVPAQRMAELLWAQQFNGEVAELGGVRRLAARPAR